MDNRSTDSSKILIGTAASTDANVCSKEEETIQYKLGKASSQRAEEVNNTENNGRRETE